MTHYRKDDGDNLLDAALEIMGSGQPAMLRVTDPHGNGEYVVGHITGVYQPRADHSLNTTISFDHTTIIVPNGSDWEFVVHEDEPTVIRQGVLGGRDPFITHMDTLRRFALEDTGLVPPGKLVIPPEVIVSGTPYPPVDGALPTDRMFPVTEEQWKAEHAGYEGGDDYWGVGPNAIGPRPVIVEWGDPTETPLECISRLNTEVVEQAGHARRLPATRDDNGLQVTVNRMIQGRVVGWENATVIRRLTKESLLVRYQSDQQERGAFYAEIRATREEWAQIDALPPVTTIR